MLMLSRKVDETIVVGDSIRITVTRITGRSRVRFAIDAPPDLRVDRAEVRAARLRTAAARRPKGGAP